MGLSRCLPGGPKRSRGSLSQVDRPCRDEQLAGPPLVKNMLLGKTRQTRPPPQGIVMAHCAIAVYFSLHRQPHEIRSAHQAAPLGNWPSTSGGEDRGTGMRNSMRPFPLKLFLGL